MGKQARLHERLVHSRRSRVLAGHLSDLIPDGCTVLDVGCGDGLVASLLAARRADLRVTGLDTLVRPGARIPVQAFDGKRIPLEDDSVDVVALIDVLHHADRPLSLLAEATRVARKYVVLKDHALRGWLAGPTLMLMDWAGNSAHGVTLPFHYWPESTWKRAFSLLGLRVDQWRGRLGLYARPLGWLFERSLHFAVRLEKESSRWAPKREEDLERAAWELAYLQFESPEQELTKFLRRLKRAGADSWRRDARILELFCGQGNGLVALERLGFRNLAGVDLSPELAAHYRGRGTIHVADCRSLPLPDRSQDIILVQGGLHHLPDLEGDLGRVTDEIRRVLVEGGRIVVIEPWLTPFLRLVHWVCRRDFLRLFHPKSDALHHMIRLEERTYFEWLNRPDTILGELRRKFRPEKVVTGWGKLLFVGANEAASPPAQLAAGKGR